MANDLAAFTPRILSSVVQDTLDGSHVGRSICNFRLEPEMSSGESVDIVRIPNLTANTYIDAAGIIIQDVVIPNDTLVVDIEQEASFDVSNKDIKQNKFSTAILMGERAGFALQDKIDATILEEAQNAQAVNVFGVMTTANIVNLFTGAAYGLRTQSVVNSGDWFAVITPRVMQLLQEKRVEVGFNTADQMISNGKVGHFLDFELLLSNSNVYNDGVDDYLLFGKKGAIDMVIQDEVSVTEFPRIATTGRNQYGKRMSAYVLYGLETTTQGAKALYTQKVQ